MKTTSKIETILLSLVGGFVKPSHEVTPPLKVGFTKTIPKRGRSLTLGVELSKNN